MGANRTIKEIQADYHLFIEIHNEKYFKINGKNEFDSESEANDILGKIISAWNDNIAGDPARIDCLSEEEKIIWFNSIVIDFTQPASIKSLEPKDDTEIKKNIKHPDDLFPFLPEFGILYVTFASPALEAFGYPYERFAAVMAGAEITEIEKDLLEWACDLGMSVFMAIDTNSAKERQRHLADAITACMEKLDSKITNEIILSIYSDISKAIEGAEPVRPKPGKKKKK